MGMESTDTDLEGLSNAKQGQGKETKPVHTQAQPHQSSAGVDVSNSHMHASPRGRSTESLSRKGSLELRHKQAAAEGEHWVVKGNMKTQEIRSKGKGHSSTGKDRPGKLHAGC